MGKNKKEKKSAETQVKRKTSRKTDIKIIGDNVLYNNGIITAFYIIPMINYSTASYSGVENSVKELKNLISNLTTNNPNLLFTIERIDKVVKRKDVLANLIDTIHIYRNDYDMPEEFTKNIKEDRHSYCILGIDIQQSNLTDVDDLTLGDTIKSIGKQAINAFAGLGNMNADPEQILKMEENLYRIIKYKCVRATKELVFYTYVSKVFPNYEISYDKLSFVNENNFESIMGSVTQTVTDNFGWFEMHNEGVDIFNYNPQTTYGCMIDIKKFPEAIETVNFPMEFAGIDYINLVTTIQCLKKEDAQLKIKRVRASDNYELQQAIESGAELEQLEGISKNVAIATHALTEIEKGEIICNFNASLLVTAETKDDLKARIAEVITSCKDRDILASKSLTQALDFLNNYINKKPQKFIHLTSIEFPLSFQQNYGSTVGDTDEVWSPAIGEDV